MKRHITTAAGMFLMVLLLFLFLGSRTAEAATTAKVTVSALNVRLGPGTGYKKISCIKVGQTYPVVDSKNGWYKLQIGSTLGWVCGDYVKTFSTEAAAPPSTQTPASDGRTSVADSITVNVNLLNVRSGNSVKTPIIGGVRKGETYTVLDSKSGWFKIKYNLSAGWVSGDYVTVNYLEDVKDSEPPKQPVLTNVFEIQDLKTYRTDTRNCIAIPLSIKVNKSGNTGTPEPGIESSRASDGKISIMLGNSSFTGVNKDIAVSDSDLFTAANVSCADQNSTTITISPKAGVDYEIYTVQAKGSEDSEYKCYNMYVVVSFKDNTNSGNAGNENAKNSQGKTKGDYLITLDAGHGGTTTGAVSGGYEERTFNMDIINRVNDILKAQGYDTYLTRSNNTYVSLAERADSANIIKSDIFVSVHLNGFVSPAVSGTETLYNSSAQSSGAALADLIQKNLINGLNRANRGIKDRPDLYVLNSTNMPAVLIEVLFMSNPEDLNVICGESARQVSAESIARAINEYFGFAN